MIIIIHKPLDDTAVQIMVTYNKYSCYKIKKKKLLLFSFKDLSNKVKNLTTQFVELSLSFNNKIEENTSIILENMRYVYYYTLLYYFYEIKIVYFIFKLYVLLSYRLIMLEKSQIETKSSKKNSIGIIVHIIIKVISIFK